MQILKPPTPGKKSPSILERLGQAILPAPTQPTKTVPTGSKSSSSVVGKAGASVGGAAPRTTGTVPGAKGTTFPSTTTTAGAGSSAAPVKTVPAAAVTPSGSANTVDPLYPPNEAQKKEADLVAKLPGEFPIMAWSNLSATTQQKILEKSGLSPQDQWKLLNASTPLDVLSLLNEIQNKAKSGLLTSSEASKITDQALRYSDDRLRIANGDASYLPPLQKALWNRELDKVFGDLQDKTKGKSSKGNDTRYNWSNEEDNNQVQPFPFPAPVPVLKDVPYPANGEKAYVFFTNSKGAMFKKQAEYQRKVLESQGYKVELVQTDNVDVFVREWDNMDPKTTTAVVLSHSNGMSLIFEKDSSTNAISATGRNRQNKLIHSIKDLNGPEIAELYIYACNAGHEELLASEGTNVADAFRDLVNVDTVYAFDGSVGFGPSCLFRTTYEPRLSNAQSYDDVFSWFDIPDTYGESGASGLLEYQSDD